MENVCCPDSSFKNILKVGFRIWCCAVFSPNKPNNSLLPVYSSMAVPSAPRWKDPGRKNAVFGKASHAEVWYFCFNQVKQILLAGLHGTQIWPCRDPVKLEKVIHNGIWLEDILAVSLRMLLQRSFRNVWSSKTMKAAVNRPVIHPNCCKI